MALLGPRGEGPAGFGAPHKSIPSILAFVCAVASFFVHSGTLGIVLAIFAIGLGVLGALLAFSNRVTGGILSLFSIGLGVVAALFGLLRGVWHVVH